jgi:hypothetical protein
MGTAFLAEKRDPVIMNLFHFVCEKGLTDSVQNFFSTSPQRFFLYDIFVKTRMLDLHVVERPQTASPSSDPSVQSASEHNTENINPNADKAGKLDPSESSYPTCGYTLK